MHCLQLILLLSTAEIICVVHSMEQKQQIIFEQNQLFLPEADKSALACSVKVKKII